MSSSLGDTELCGLGIQNFLLAWAIRVLHKDEDLKYLWVKCTPLNVIWQVLNI